MYQLNRSDNTQIDVSPVHAGGVVNTAAHDAFCAGAQCTILMFYDQTGNGNHLTRSPYFNQPTVFDNPVNASALPITFAGTKVYGAKFEFFQGYRRLNSRNDTVGMTDFTFNIAMGSQAESTYMVTSGKYFTNHCCFDFGNGEAIPRNDGGGTMQAIYFGADLEYLNQTSLLGQNITGPFVMADFENGMYMGNGFQFNPQNMPQSQDFVTALLKGALENRFVIKAGDATGGTLTTMWDGIRTYQPPNNWEGGIILGTGGDNSFYGNGVFFEGAIAQGFMNDATDAALQANVVAAGYQSLAPPLM